MDTAIGELELDGLDPDTAQPPKESRLRDVTAGLALYTNLRDADQTASIARARLDAMYDGVPPYDQGILAATGQGARTNLNFGEAQRQLDIEMSAYVDLITSLESLFLVFPKAALEDPAARQQLSEVAAAEASDALREWPEFESSYLRMCNEKVKHGVGATYFADTESPRFKVSGLNDFLIPRQCPASENAIEYAATRHSYLLHELYAFIRNPDAAKARGWNPDEVRRVMLKNATNTPNAAIGEDWEVMQREMKNNDLSTSAGNTTVSVVTLWVREITGKVSMFAFAEDAPADFMFKRINMFEHPAQAYVLFANGVGTNGTYHSVRGQGQRIFPHVQLSNRMRSQTVDAAMMSGSVMIQPETERALEKLSFTMYGAYSILSPDMKVIEKATPNLATSMQPALEMIETQLMMNADPSSVYGANRASPYRNEMQVEHDLAVGSRLSGSTLNLFYMSWSRLLREVLRRLCTSPDAMAVAFRKRCAERGVGPELLKMIDHSRTVAVRAIGAGSAANRLLALRDLKQYAGEYDEVGRRNLLRDITGMRVGRDLVDRYAPPSPEPRPTVEGKLALMENAMLEQGGPVPVMPSELHGEHMRVAHAPRIQELIAGIESGELDPVAVLPALEALHMHAAEHTEYLSMDLTATEAPGYRQMLQQSEEIIVNFRKKIAAMQRQAMEQGMPAEGGEQPQGPSDAELKLQEHQVKMQIAQQKAETDMQIKQAKAQQEMALKDAERARKMEES